MIPTFLTMKDQSVVLNDLARYCKGGVLTCGEAFLPIVIPAAALAANPTLSAPIIVEGNEDAVSEIFSAMGFHDDAVDPDVQARMTVLVTDTSWRRRLMNREILVNHFFGSNQQPCFFSETILLRGQQTLYLQFANPSIVDATDFRFAFEHRKFQATALSRPQVTQHLAREDRNKLFRTPYWLTSDAAITIPASGTVTAFFTTTRDIITILYSATASFISAGVAGDIVEGFTVRLFDAATDRPLQNQPVARSCCSGSAGFPFVFPTGWMIEPNTKIRAEFTNLITDAATEVFWTFKGVASLTAINPFENRHTEFAPPGHYRVGAP